MLPKPKPPQWLIGRLLPNGFRLPTPPSHLAPTQARSELAHDSRLQWAGKAEHAPLKAPTISPHIHERTASHTIKATRRCPDPNPPLSSLDWPCISRLEPDATYTPQVTELVHTLDTSQMRSSKALTYPPGGPANGFPGSLFGTGHNWN